MPDKTTEIWEATTDGTTYVNVKDPRNADGWVRRKVGGRGSKRLTLSTDERLFNQELVQFENEHLDPFSNGMLVRVMPKDVERGEHEKTDDDLIAILNIEDDLEFEVRIDGITSELIMRRLLTLARKHSTMLRFEKVQTLVDERYAIGKTSRVVREMENDDSRYVDADM